MLVNVFSLSLCDSRHAVAYRRRKLDFLRFLLCLLVSRLRLPIVALAESSKNLSQKVFDENRAPADRPSSKTRRGEQRPNFLVIVCDQLRYDALGFVQKRMPSVYSSKIKIRTPNLDRLAARGIVFENAYTTSPSCGPARTSLKTGCTLGRTGLVSNKMIGALNLTRSVPIFRDRIEKLVTYEQVLAQDLKYNVESYGKWHTDPSMFYTKTNPPRQAVRYTSLDWRRNQPKFVPAQTIKPIYLQSLEYLLPRAGVSAIGATLREGQLVSKLSEMPYSPAMIDGRYGYPALNRDWLNSNTTRRRRQRPRPNFKDTQVGRDSLGPNLTSTAVVGQISVRALDRNIRQYQASATPFLLSVHFNAPHPPVIGCGTYFDFYYRNRYNLAVPASLLDPMQDSAYKWSNQRKFLLRMMNEGAVGGGVGAGDDDYDEDIVGSNAVEDTENGNPSYVNASFSDPSSPNYYPYADRNRIAELTAAYYSMVEEVDAWIGRLVQRLERARMLANTLIVFTSDHGDMLGAHGMTGKNVLLEEAVRVPLILSAPDIWDGGRILKRPVSHLSLFATLLDYAGASPARVESSDGQSLRSFIERTCYNRDFDDDVVVVELNGRRPIMEGNNTPSVRLAGALGGQPAFMVRKGKFKLILPRGQNSSVVDMMYDLSTDPSEMTNLLANISLSDAVIGKAEHLKALLIEWLARHDGDSQYGGYYSSNAFHMSEGSGDINEISRRKSWRSTKLWISDVSLRFGKPARLSSTSASPSSVSGMVPYIRNEYLWAGRTEDGEAFLWVHVQGPDAAKFRVEPDHFRLRRDERVRIRVTLHTSTMASTRAYLRIKVSTGGTVSYRNVPLSIAPAEDEEQVLPPGAR